MPAAAESELRLGVSPSLDEVRALVALLAHGAGDLLGLLLHLRARERGIGQQLRRVRALGGRGRTGGDRALQAGQDLVRGLRLQLTPVEARALPRVACGAVRLDERHQGVAVAVVADRAHRLGVPRGRALVPQLLPGAAPQMELAGGARALERPGVHVGEREHLARVPVLDHAGHEPLRVVGDPGVVHGDG